MSKHCAIFLSVYNLLKYYDILKYAGAKEWGYPWLISAHFGEFCKQNVLVTSGP
jgi:hypothetical protein